MHEFSIDGSVEEMDEGDLRATLDEFMEKHAENVEAYSEVVAERDEFSEQVEDLEGQVEAHDETEAALTEKFSAVVAEESPLFTAEEVADRFSLGELIEKADALGAFSLAAPEEAEPEAEVDDGFSEKPGKGKVEAGRGQFSEEASADLDRILGL